MLMDEMARRGFPREQMAGYDPGIPDRAALPEPADFVVSTDVLEHVEPEKLDGVLKHIRELTKRQAYLNIHTGPANAKLPDGRNAHLIQQPAEWWHRKLYTVFTHVDLLQGGLRPTFVCG
jgi:cyclopropane fatty-acyl-phospholipid synthase-like methyltransferase